MPMLRSLACLILVLALAVGSVGAAVARGQPMAVGQMVICADGAAAVVLVDAEGQPVGHASCPECLAGGAADLPVASVVPLGAGRLLSVAFVPAPSPGRVASADLTPIARGPPGLV
jgi:hypothetical protein